MQTTNHVLMVRPVRFAFNEQTASNNAFQQKTSTDEAVAIQRQAVAEFDAYVGLLRAAGVRVTVLQDTPEPFTPDSIFPNNCFSTHRDADGHSVLVLYPMFAPNRRLERVKLLSALDIASYDRQIDLTAWEQQALFLEGTGSLVLDREHRVAYACRSPRTDEHILREWAVQLGYDYLLFDSVDAAGRPVYHTNVVMHVGTHHAVVCLDSIADSVQRQHLCDSLQAAGKEVVSISFGQMNHFAGNMLELQSVDGSPILVMSATAKASLTAEQLSTLERFTHILAPDISAIEKAGGGSVRCMLAEIF